MRYRRTVLAEKEAVPPYSVLTAETHSRVEPAFKIRILLRRFFFALPPDCSGVREAFVIPRVSRAGNAIPPALLGHLLPAPTGGGSQPTLTLVRARR